MQNETTPWRTLYQLALPYRRQFLFIALLAVAATSLDLVEPLIYRAAINDVAGLFVDRFNENPPIDDDLSAEPSLPATTVPAVPGPTSSPFPAPTPATTPSPVAETQRTAQPAPSPRHRLSQEERERRKRIHERRRQVHEEKRLEQTAQPHRPDYIAPRTPKQTIRTLLWAVALLFLTGIGSYFLSLRADNRSTKLASRIEADLIRSTFGHVLRLPLEFFSKRASGGLAIKVIDALLKTETATGPVWHRYNEDGYGEHEDGSPFDGTGIGRGWPLLAGERAHYELIAGNRAEAERLLHVMEAQASPGGLIPEQVWDAPDIPDLELFNGRPAGSAMPLVWAHAEYIKLVRSLRDESVFDLPPQTVQRYQQQRVTSDRSIWRFNHKCRSIPAGKVLRIETGFPCRLRWSADGWQSASEVETEDTKLNVHFTDLRTDLLPSQATVAFTFFWLESQRWEGVNYEVTISQ